jgi:hypothetical protein
MKYGFMHIDYDCGFDSKGYNKYCFGFYCNDDIRKSNCDKIRKNLISIFPSIMFESNIYKKDSGKYATFYISDPAEEAHFILWSGVSDGYSVELKDL